MNRKEEVYQSRNGEVTILIPPQEVPVEVVELEEGTIRLCKEVPSVFQLIRVVVEIKLVEAANPEVIVERFDPPIQLRVKVAGEDIEIAGNSLTLAYCSGVGKLWKPFTTVQYDFHFEPEKQPSAGGEGVATIREWEDPAIGWGH
jgi:hypothetical protein